MDDDEPDTDEESDSEPETPKNGAEPDSDSESPADDAPEKQPKSKHSPVNITSDKELASMIESGILKKPGLSIDTNVSTHFDTPAVPPNTPATNIPVPVPSTELEPPMVFPSTELELPSQAAPLPFKSSKPERLSVGKMVNMIENGQMGTPEMRR